jgi:ferredoxin-NADP reductase
VNGELKVTVREIRSLAPDIKEFCLAPVGGGDLPAFSAGSHILVSLPIGGGRSHLNAYSLMGDPLARDSYRIAVRRMEPSRGGSQFLHDKAQLGSELAISHPVNLFAIQRAGRKHLLLAGGIGVTPILAQARQLAAAGADFEVHYAFRNPEQGAFTELFKELAGERAHFYIDSKGEAIPFAKLFADQPLGTHAYVCGPDGMRVAAFKAGKEAGWPASHLHSEQFLAPQKGSPFTVFLKRSNLELTVPPDMSILEAVEQAGVDAPYLCRGGACGQCECEVLETDGSIGHRDVVLSDLEKSEGRKMMICVSRLEGARLVLNL